MMKSLFFGYLITLSLIVCWSFAASQAFAAPDTYIEPVTGMEFVHVPAGTFTMGDAREDLADLGRVAELPAHKVTLSGFYIGTTEVTFAQYDIFSRETGRPLADDNGWGRGNRPVINVSWIDALDFALWLSEKTGRIFRLPSESQWEYAARAGTKTRFWWGNEINPALVSVIPQDADPADLKTAPVAAFLANPWGLYDTSGNVWEWCLDRFHENYTGAPNDGSPWLGAQVGTNEKVVRGGSYRDRDFYLASATRTYYDEDTRKPHLGFRLVMTEENPAATPEKQN